MPRETNATHAILALTVFAGAAATALLAANVLLRSSADATSDDGMMVASAGPSMSEPGPSVPPALPPRPEVIPAAWAVVPPPAADGPAEDATVPDRPAPPPDNPPPAAEMSRPAPVPPAPLDVINRPAPADRDPTPVKAAEYMAELLKVPEISLHTFGATPRHFQRQPGGSKHPMLDLIDSREDLHGLPVRRDVAAQLDHRTARTLDVMSRQLRGSIGNVLTMSPAPPVKSAKADRQTRSILTITGIGEVRPTLLVWVLQAEGEVMRRDMLDLIGHKPSPAAAEALAQRALFDADPALRRRAVKLLQACPPEITRAVLLAGLRYPWVTTADNAATALIALNDRGAVPELISLLDEPNPSGPVPGEDGTPTMHELMRINHFHNCQLCHAPSWDRSDLVRGPVPSADRTLPSPYGGQNYYAGGTSSGYKSRSSSGGRSNGKSPGPPPSSTAEFVRADVSYLRPDFSMSLPVADPGPWPKMQRYDFFVRTRAAQPWELSTASASQSYPQRDAVLRVLRHLANQDFGEASASWRAGLGLPAD